MAGMFQRLCDASLIRADDRDKSSSMPIAHREADARMGVAN
jgi:hypothetical protein